MSTPTENAAADTETRGRAAGNSFVVDVWIVLKRWVTKTVRNPFTLSFSLLQPVIFLVLFTIVFGQITGPALTQQLGTDVSYVTYLMPAIVIQSAFVAAAGSGIGLVDDMENGMFEKELASPINRAAIFLGKALSEIVQIIFQTIIIIIVLGYGLLWLESGGSPGTYIDTGILGALGIIVVAVVFALWFTAISNILGLVTQDTQATIIGGNLLQFPLLFVSSAFVPVALLPDWIQAIATVNPITYGVDAARSLVLGQNSLDVINVTTFSGIWNALIPAFVILLVLDLVLGAIAVRYLTRASSSSAR